MDIINIENGIEKIKSIDRANINEATGKATIVLPMLRALGWDTTDPDECQLEYCVATHLKGFADIALFSGGKPRVLLETKAPNKKLATTKHQVQVLEYCKMLKVSLGVLTNGVTWHFFYLDQNSDDETPLAETIDLDQDDVRDCGRKLRQLLSRDKVSDGGAQTHTKEAWMRRILATQWKALLSSCDKTLVNKLRKSVKLEGIRIPIESVKQFLKEQATFQSPPAIPTKHLEKKDTRTCESALRRVEEHDQTRQLRVRRLHPRPTHVEVQGRRFEVKNWREGMMRFLSEAYNSAPEKFDSMSDELQKKLRIVPTSRKLELATPKQIAKTGLWIESRGNRTALRKRCLKVQRLLLGWPEDSLIFLNGNQPVE